MTVFLLKTACGYQSLIRVNDTPMGYCYYFRLIFDSFTASFPIIISSSFIVIILAQHALQGAGAAALAGTRSEAKGKERQRLEKSGCVSRQVRRPCRPHEVCRTPLCPFLFYDVFLIIDVIEWTKPLIFMGFHD